MKTKPVRVAEGDDAFSKLAHQMDRMMKEMMSRNFFRSCGPDSWQPALNVYELDARWVVCVELAGMGAEHIDVFTADSVLHIRGARPKPAIPEAEGDVSVHVMEIDSGRFHRQVAVPATVDTSKIHAIYRNGYLWVTCPKKGGAKGGRS